MIFVKYSPVKLLFTNQKKKKKNTCEEDRAQIRISVWHLLMNLKNNYSLKKLLNWTNKKCKNFIFNSIVFFFSKKKEKHLEKIPHLIVFPDVYTVNTLVWEI